MAAPSSVTSAETSPPSSSFESANGQVIDSKSADGSNEVATDDSSKLRMFLGILRKYVNP